MSRWEKESQAVSRAVKSQVYFDFSKDAYQALRLEAAQREMSLSDVIREILGLKISDGVQRLRVGISINAEERQAIAKAYDIQDAASPGLKAHCQKLIATYFNKS